MKIVALSGGVGGARLLDGLARALPAGSLTAIVNTGDDFVHLGLHVSPDLDTVMYTLSGFADEERGWGLAGETFAGLAMVKRYGGPDWFALGDRDLATHLIRSEALRDGEPLSSITARLCKSLGIPHPILPMSNACVQTRIETTGEGTLPFQQWFVRRRAEPRVRKVHFEQGEAPAPGVLAAIETSDVVVFGPSNPYVSIDPILAVSGIRDALSRKPVVAVSPVVGGAAVKGPLASMIQDLRGEAPSAGAIARHYGGLLSAMVVERGDEATVASIPTLGTSTVMRSLDDRLRLAREVLSFAENRLHERVSRSPRTLCEAGGRGGGVPA
jgi:LPPG:FO 2-phospho-L-lactate transferase